MDKHLKSFKTLWLEIITIEKDSNRIIISPHTLEQPMQILTHEINPYSEDILLNEIDLDSNVNKWCSFSVLDVWHKGVFRVINEFHYEHKKKKNYYILELIYLPMDASSTLKVGDRYVFPKISSSFTFNGIDCRIHYYSN